MIHDTKKYKKRYMMRKNIKTIYNTFYELMTMLVTITKQSSWRDKLVIVLTFTFLHEVAGSRLKPMHPRYCGASTIAPYNWFLLLSAFKNTLNLLALFFSLQFLPPEFSRYSIVFLIIMTS